MKNRKSGFSFIELIVTIALLAITTAVLIGSYVTVMENQRQKTDISTLESIDISLQEVFLYNDAFKEAKSVVKNDYMIDLEFTLEMTADGDAYVDIAKALINGTTSSLEETCPRTCEYLIDLIGERINLQSSAYKKGTYNVHIEFGGAQVSSIRDFEITNDLIIITNSGAEYMYEMD